MNNLTWRQLSYIDRIKLLMMATMTMGHLAWIFVPVQTVLGQALHFVARITIPLACLLVVEGLARTKNLPAYLRRLFGFALLAQLPFIATQLGWQMQYWDWQVVLSYWNVLATLGLALVALIAWQKITQATMWQATHLFWALLMLVAMWLSAYADWGLAVLVWVLVIYHFRARGFLWATFGLFTVSMLLMLLFDRQVYLLQPWYLMEYGLFLAYPVMRWYDANKAKSPTTFRLPRLMFYWYYVLHLACLGLMVDWWESGNKGH